MLLPQAEVEAVLPRGASLLHCVQLQRFMATETFTDSSFSYAAITSDGFSLLSNRGILKKKIRHEASWDFSDLERRTNVSSGTIDGRQNHAVAMFGNSGETLMFMFDSEREAKHMNDLIHQTLS